MYVCTIHFSVREGLVNREIYIIWSNTSSRLYEESEGIKSFIYRQIIIIWSNTPSFYEESNGIKSVPVKQLRTCSQGYRLMDLSVLQNVFTVLKCPQCDEQGTLVLDEVHEKQKGLASNLV